jgi:hypothetical protein
VSTMHIATQIAVESLCRANPRRAFGRGQELPQQGARMICSPQFCRADFLSCCRPVCDVYMTTFCSPGSNATENEGVLALELTLRQGRLEPITGNKTPVKGSRAQDTGIGRPSTHWRGICEELPTLATPVHHLFSLPAGTSSAVKPCTVESPKPCTTPQLARPVSCPSSLCSCDRDTLENVSYTAFRRSLAAVQSLQLPHAYLTPRVLLGEHARMHTLICGHGRPDSNREPQCSPTSLHHRRTDHDASVPRGSTAVGVR